MIAIIDYGAGNLRSVVKALTKLGYQSRVTGSPADLKRAKAVVLPGVGAAPDAMARLRNAGLIAPLLQWVADGRPFLGICLGFQLLFAYSEEGVDCPCLGLLPGTVKRLPSSLKVPHIGWNQVEQRISHPLFEGIPNRANFYFVHSYYPEVADASLVAGQTEYGLTFPSMVIRGKLVATQFHPEKSGELGLRLYGNFLKFAVS
ncbi:MAG: imidazole glycerol phosphate synthase subunit HisH [Chloroflexi bacterium]|nr:imidazole glycerol phosphate synthase subunit HisH [Chloroflexota bacterium]